MNQKDNCRARCELAAEAPRSPFSLVTWQTECRCLAPSLWPCDTWHPRSSSSRAARAPKAVAESDESASNQMTAAFAADVRRRGARATCSSAYRARTRMPTSGWPSSLITTPEIFFAFFFLASFQRIGQPRRPLSVAEASSSSRLTTSQVGESGGLLVLRVDLAGPISDRDRPTADGGSRKLLALLAAHDANHEWRLRCLRPR